MLRALVAVTVVALCVSGVEAQSAKLNDAQVSHVAYTAGDIDVIAGKQAIAKSKNKEVVAFAQEMVRDHNAVDKQALALCRKLGVTPQDNAISQELSKDAAAKLSEYGKLKGAAFDKAYVANEVAYHKAVLAAISGTLIPNAENTELKSLLQSGFKLFTEHEAHAEHLAASLK